MEPTICAKADEYCFKEKTRVDGTQFEFGTKAIKRNSGADWARVRQLAQSNRLEEVEAQIYVTHYNGLKRIAMDFMAPLERPGIEVRVYYGPTHTGKTHKAVEWLGNDYYDKGPTHKWWNGYKGQKEVLIDEFRGKIDVSHLLKWCDYRKCSVESKGSETPLCVTKLAITSNLNPLEWWPELDGDTYQAFKRRCKFIEMNERFVFQENEE